MDTKNTVNAKDIFGDSVSEEQVETFSESVDQFSKINQDIVSLFSDENGRVSQDAFVKNARSQGHDPHELLAYYEQELTQALSTADSMLLSMIGGLKTPGR